MATKVIRRSSETGKFVTTKFTQTHPQTTETERVHVPTKKK